MTRVTWMFGLRARSSTRALAVMELSAAFAALYIDRGRAIGTRPRRRAISALMPPLAPVMTIVLLDICILLYGLREGRYNGRRPIRSEGLTGQEIQDNGEGYYQSRRGARRDGLVDDCVQCFAG